MKRSDRAGTLLLAAFFAASSAVCTHAFELGASLSGGVGFWSGQWSSSVKTFSEDFGQTVSPSVFPVGSFFVDIANRSDPLVLSIAVGAGAWGGRCVSSGGSSPDRVSSIVFIGLDAAPSIGLRFPLGKGEIGGDLRLGMGIAVSPVWTIDAWSSMSAVASYAVPAADLGYAYAGLSLLYRIPLADRMALDAFLSGDVGLAAFDASTGTATRTVLSRINLGARFSYDFTAKRRAAR